MVAGVSENRSRPARVGFIAVLAAAIAVAAGYVNNCFSGIGLGPGQGPGTAAEVKQDAEKRPEPATSGRIVVQGEHCRLDGDATTQACDDLCNKIKATAIDIEATVGAHGTVERLRACLQGRGIKVQIRSE